MSNDTEFSGVEKHMRFVSSEDKHLSLPETVGHAVLNASLVWLEV